MHKMNRSDLFTACTRFIYHEHDTHRTSVVDGNGIDRQDSCMSDRSVDQGRRRLCKMACASGGLLALSALPGCGTESTGMASCSTASVGVGDAAKIAVGSAMYIESVAVFICRDDGGYYAIDAACTHIGTDVDFIDAKSGFKCPLHFSLFDFNGHVLTGPATIDLPHYSLCTTDSGILVVDTQKRVTPDTRLIV